MLPIKKDDNIIYLENIINDLILVLSMHIQDYPFDDNDITKQKDLIIKGYRAIGTPINMEEMSVAIAWMR
jgi:hypothetical protein